MKLLAMFLSSWAALALPSAPATAPLKEVTLERTPCFGACPVYKLTLRSDGTLTYEGTRFVERTGKWTATFPGHQLELFAKLAEKSCFWTLLSKYSVPATDLPSTLLTLKTDDRAKTVEEYGTSGPSELWALQQSAAGIAFDAQNWKKVGDK